MSIRTSFESRGQAVVARLTIDNARKLNALGRAALAELVAAMRDIEGKEPLRAVVLTGAGDKAFVGGAHLDDLAPIEASVRASIDAFALSAGARSRPGRRSLKTCGHPTRRVR